MGFMRLAAAITLLTLLAFAGQVAAQDSEQPTGTISVDDSTAQDARIATRIRDILGALETYENVSISVDAGIVTLEGRTLDGTSADRLNDIVARVEGVVAIENEVTETTDVVERLNPALERFKDRITQTIALLPLLAVALIIMAVIVFAGFAIARLRQPWDRLAPNSFISDIYRQIIRVAFVIGAVVVALDLLGAYALLSTILGAAGIIGLAIGFAVRDTVENFIASVMLSIRQPFRPNDTVEIDGDIGNVIRLTSRATILLSFDGNHIRIPNATVFKSRIINYSRADDRRFVFDLGVAPDSDLGFAQKVAMDTLESLPFVLGAPAPAVWVEDAGDSTVTLRVTGWIAQHRTSFAGARGEAIRQVMTALSAAGVDMPEPTFRIAAPAPAARPETAKAPRSSPPAEVDATKVAALPEGAIEKIVEAERAGTDNPDLLNSAAPEE